MKIGICAKLEQSDLFEAMGFDYIEPAVTALMEMSGSDLSAAARRIEAGKLSVEACNVFLPGSIRVVGPEADTSVLKAYLGESLPRVASLGAKYVVFGSGASRKAPDGFDQEAAFLQLKTAFSLAGEEASRHNLTIVIEPLNSKETNMINSVSEGLRMAEAVNHPNVKLLADFYHMRMEKETFEGITSAGAMLRHTHIANSNGRVYPLDLSEDSYGAFFAALESIGYNGGISIEAATHNIEEEAPKSLALLRHLANLERDSV